MNLYGTVVSLLVQLFGSSVIPAWGQTFPSTSFQDTIPNAKSFFQITAINMLHYQFGPDDNNAFDRYEDEDLELITDIRTADGTDVVLLAAPESKRLIVNFRGTDNEEPDQDANADFTLSLFGDRTVSGVDWPKGRSFNGYNVKLFGQYKLYLTLDELVKSNVAKYPDYELTISGHSQGGGLAIMYGAYLAKIVLKDINVLVQTLATPRIGDRTFKSSLRSISNLANFRMVHRLDLVPRVPMETLGYRHPGHLIFLRGDDTKAYFEQTGDGVTYAGVGQSFLLPNGVVGAVVVDHLSSSYLNGIIEAVDLGVFPTEFVPIEEQEMVCCSWFLWIWCTDYGYPPC